MTTKPINVRMAQAADMAGLKMTKFTALCDRGEIRTFKVGRARLVEVAELERWTAAQLAAQAPAGTK